MQVQVLQSVLQSYLEFCCFNFWDRLLLWEYKDEGSSGFLIAVLFSTESHVSPYGAPQVHTKRSTHSAV